MGYEAFYLLRFEPFANHPDPRFYFNSPQHALAREYLLHSARGRRGLALLLGELGTGKTTLCRRILGELAAQGEYQVGLLVLTHSDFSPIWLLQKIAVLLGLHDIPLDTQELFGRITQRLKDLNRTSRRVVIIIDEANKLITPECAEELRGLLNLELDGGMKLITFILSGLPPLNDFLVQNPALYQRVAVKVYLKPLDAMTVKTYIRHRLSIAGREQELFTEPALDLIANYSGGRPRLVNIICDNALLQGYMERKPVIDEFIIEQVATTLDLKPI
jgi:type II secretory pathway predicted ATPase ExeA